MSFIKKIKLPPKVKRVLLAIFYTVRDILILIAATYGFNLIRCEFEFSNAAFVTIGILLPTLCTFIIFVTDKRRKQYVGKIIATHIIFAVGNFAYFGYTLLMTGENFYGIDNQLLDSLFLYLLMRILFKPAKSESISHAAPDAADKASVQTSADISSAEKAPAL